MSGTVIDLAPDEWRARVVASADKRWPGASVMRVRCVWRTKKGRLKMYRTYGAFSNGALIATAKVNLAGAVYWRTPWPGEKWEVE